MTDQRKPDGGLAEWIEVLEDDRADNAELLCLLLELRRYREDSTASPNLPPPGWKLVPVEPTKEMRLASRLYVAKTKLTTGPGFYRAMLAAAPEVE